MKYAQFCAYFRLRTILVCSCDQSHVQDKLKLPWQRVPYDFMHIATKMHEVTWLEYEICTVQAKKLTCSFLITSRKVDHFLL